MPKNSRPDIQVLEDRIVRLKNQLLEYKDLRLYSVTKNRLSAVSDELVECIEIIDNIVSSGSNNISASSLSALSECPVEGPSEFSSDSDLLDTFLLSSPDTSIQSSSKSARDIVKTYSKRLEECAATTGLSSGIIQVNQFCQLLNSWYQMRFSPENRNPNFFFKAARIHEWIDLLIIAAGHSMHEGLYPAFLSDMNTWIKDLNTSRDQSYVLPYSVMRMKNLDSSCCSREAVLLETIIKPTIYDESFYQEEIDSVRQIVINNSEFSEEDLKIDTIIQHCPRIIVTNSFDPSKYQEA